MQRSLLNFFILFSFQKVGDMRGGKRKFAAQCITFMVLPDDLGWRLA